MLWRGNHGPATYQHPPVTDAAWRQLSFISVYPLRRWRVKYQYTPTSGAIIRNAMVHILSLSHDSRYYRAEVRGKARTGKWPVCLSNKKKTQCAGKLLLSGLDCGNTLTAASGACATNDWYGGSACITPVPDDTGTTIIKQGLR